MLLNELMVNKNLTRRLNNDIECLGNIRDESERASIISNLISKDEIFDILEAIIKQPSQSLAQYVSISGAGMIKLKLKDSNNGQIRYHIFSSKVKNIEGIDFDKNPHMHDFQSYSHVLSGSLIEDRYKVAPLSIKEAELYRNLITSIGNINKVEREELYQNFNNLGEEITINGVTYFMKEIESLYTIYNSRKETVDKNLIEHFFPIGERSFNKLDTRKIVGYDTYFLDAEIAHKISYHNDVATFFIADTTYASVGHKKKNSTFLRGHGIKFPDEQPSKILRGIVDPTNETNKLISILKDITKQIL